MKVILLARAQQDLRRILEYFEWYGSSPSVGQRFLTSFEETCPVLGEHPQIGSIEEPPSASRHIHAEVRRFAVIRFPSYLIFYRVSEASILIQRVLHAARNPNLRTEDPF